MILLFKTFYNSNSLKLIIKPKFGKKKKEEFVGIFGICFIMCDEIQLYSAK